MSTKTALSKKMESIIEYRGTVSKRMTSTVHTVNLYQCADLLPELIELFPKFSIDFNVHNNTAKITIPI